MKLKREIKNFVARKRELEISTEWNNEEETDSEHE